mmetsp:Transcript_110248/g.225404  ORF Transcript_110248/g.225404 Transcript_110248/m.225404 type:complete len:98 (+) Transcript_110248:1097-1390(+)
MTMCVICIIYPAVQRQNNKKLSLSCSSVFCRNILPHCFAFPQLLSRFRCLLVDASPITMFHSSVTSIRLHFVVDTIVTSYLSIRDLLLNFRLFIHSV